MHLGWAEIQLGNRSSGRELLAAAVDSLRRRANRSRSPTGSRQARLAAAFAALGRTEQAIEKLTSATRNGFAETAWVETYPLLGSLRSNSRFQGLVDSVRLNQERLRERVRGMDLDLYPPGRQAGTPSDRRRE